MSNPRFYPELESLRGLAAFSVMVAHCFARYRLFPGSGPVDGWQAAANAFIHVLFDGNSAVVLFFVLSGYVLGLQLDGMKGGPVQMVRAFWIRRLFRIGPAMWITVGLAYAVATRYRPESAPSDVLISALLFNGRALLGTLWTLTVEMGCALVFPALYWLERTRGLIVNLAVFAVLLWMMQLGELPEWARYPAFFHAGLMVDRIGRLPRWALGAALVAYAVTPTICATLGLSVLIWLRVDLVACVVILACVIHQKAFCRLLNLSGARYLGRISYSVYLLHFVVIEAVFHAILLPLSGGYDTPYPIAFQALCALIVVPVTLVLSHGLFLAVERPANRLGAWIAATTALRSSGTPARRSAASTSLQSPS